MSLAELQSLSLPQLLRLHGLILGELRRREICRTENGPTGDYAEYLVTQKLGLALNGNSTAGCDCVDSNGTRYQIKGRRVTPSNRSTQLGAIRKLELAEFDFVIGVLFDQFYSVTKVVKVPHAVVTEHARFRSHENGHILHINGRLLADRRVEDLTRQFLSSDVTQF